MNEFNEILYQQASDALARLGMPAGVTVEEVTQSVQQQTVYWEKSLPSGDKVLFAHLFSPVIQRAEVFLGNVLFNTFLSKTFVHAVSENQLGQAEPIANDLENFYFLVRTTADIAQLAEALRAAITHGLPDLFFEDTDSEKGIYGSLEMMLDFNKANVEPFPVFIMPQAYAARLEIAVRASLLRKIEKEAFDRNPTSIMANLAFFYSHDGAEMQSPYMFLARLALRYHIIDPEQLREALVLDKGQSLDNEADAKKIIEDSLKQKGERTFAGESLRKVLHQALMCLGEAIENNPEEWRMPYIRSKFLDYERDTLIESLITGVTVGPVALGVVKRAEGFGCRICGEQPLQTEEKTILMGQNVHKFHNQSGKQHNSDQPKTCLRCATFTYLMVKLMGSEAVGQPQVPKTYNLIFHYGQHTDQDVAHLAMQFDTVWRWVKNYRGVERLQRDISRLTKQLEETRSKRKQQRLSEELEQKQSVLQTATAESETLQAQLDPWLLEDPDLSAPSSTSCASDILYNLQADTQIAHHVLGLGMGGYRMVLFVLPKIHPPRGNKEQDIAQGRFSSSRIMITTFLSFLHKLCGCDGPFYYQSLPLLTPDAFNRDTFYVRDEAISIDDAQREYVAVTQIAWKLLKRRSGESSQKFFVRKIVLAERLLEDPLSTFSNVMRNSAILGQREGSYRYLGGKYNPDWKTKDLTQYEQYIQQLSILQEVR